MDAEVALEMSTPGLYASFAEPAPESFVLCGLTKCSPVRSGLLGGGRGSLQALLFTF